MNIIKVRLMNKNLEILKGIDFSNLNDEGLKKLLVDKFSKNINKAIIPGESYIPVSGKVIDEEDVLWGIESMMDAWLTAGRFSIKLERELARYFGSRFSFLVNSGSSANLLAFYALTSPKLLDRAIKPGDEIITVAAGFPTTINPMIQFGCIPVFVDVDIPTYNIKVEDIEKAITPKTKAILSVHEFGLAANIEAIQAICTKHNLVFLEDAACALGAEYNGSKTGTFGQSASFSLHPRKAITSGEGGLIVSGDKAFIEKCKILRNHGVNPVAGHTGFTEAGFNYRMTDFQAALVLSQFKRFQEILDAKQAIAKQFLADIKNSKLTLPKVEEGYYHSWQSFHIILNGISQVEAIAKLKEAGIAANYGAQCIPHMDFYKNKYNFNAAELFPNAFNAWQNGLVIPLYPQLNNNEIEHIIHSINQL